MTNYQLHFQLNKSDYWRFFGKTFTDWKTYKQLLILWGVLTASIFVYNLKGVDWGQMNNSDAWITHSHETATTSLIVCAITLAFFLILWRTYPLFNGPTGQCSLQLKTEGFVLTDSKGFRRFYDLETLRYINKSKHFFFLFYGSKDGFPLPQSAFPSPLYASHFYQQMAKVKKDNLTTISNENYEEMLGLF